MDDKLHQLTRKLREERCPTSALDHVQARIERDFPRSVRTRNVMFATCALAVLCLLATVFIRDHGSPEQAALASVDTPSNEQTVKELQASLTVVGYSLMDAGKRTRLAISKKIKPRLVRGFEQATQTIIEKL